MGQAVGGIIEGFVQGPDDEFFHELGHIIVSEFEHIHVLSVVSLVLMPASRKSLMFA